MKATRYKPVIEADQSDTKVKATGPISQSYSQTLFGEATAIRDSATQQILANLLAAETKLSAEFLANTASLVNSTPAPSYSSPSL